MHTSAARTHAQAIDGTSIYRIFLRHWIFVLSLSLQFYTHGNRSIYWSLRLRSVDENNKRKMKNRLGWRWCNVVVFHSKMETLVFLFFHVCDGPYRPMSVLAHAVSRSVRLALADGERLSVPRLCIQSANKTTIPVSLERIHTPTHPTNRPSTLRRFMLSDAHRMRNRKEKYIYSFYCSYILTVPTLLWTRREFHKCVQMFLLDLVTTRAIRSNEEHALCDGRSRKSEWKFTLAKMRRMRIEGSGKFCFALTDKIDRLLSDGRFPGIFLFSIRNHHKSYSTMSWNKQSMMWIKLQGRLCSDWVASLRIWIETVQSA